MIVLGRGTPCILLDTFVSIVSEDTPAPALIVSLLTSDTLNLDTEWREWSLCFLRKKLDSCLKTSLFVKQSRADTASPWVEVINEDSTWKNQAIDW